MVWDVFTDVSVTDFTVGSESPCPAELPTYIVYFFQIHPRWNFFINNFYLK